MVCKYFLWFFFHPLNMVFCGINALNLEESNFFSFHGLLKKFYVDVWFLFILYKNLIVRVLVWQTRFVCPTCGKLNTEMPRCIAEKRFIWEAVKWGDGKTSLKSAFWRWRAQDKIKVWVSGRKVIRDIRQVRKPVRYTLCRCIWATCFFMGHMFKKWWCWL